MCEAYLQFLQKRKKAVTYNMNETAHENSNESRSVKRQNLIKLFSMLAFKDRFLLLLFCQQKFSAKQISEVLNMPVFLIRKRFFQVINLAGKYIDLG